MPTRIVPVSLAVLLLTAATADAGPRQTVIVTGTQAQVSAVAVRHGATIKKRLKTGAVIEVERETLETLGADAFVHENHPVHANSDITSAIFTILVCRLDTS